MEWVELTKEAISKTLETMFFTFVEFDGTDEDSSYEKVDKITSYIKLSSDKTSAFIVISIVEPLAFQMAADFTGTIVEKVKREDVEDCLRELANMVGGYCVNSMGGRYALGLPQIGFPPETGVTNQCSSFSLFVLGEKFGEMTVCVVQSQ